MKRNCLPDRWKYMQALPNKPIMKWEDCISTIEKLGIIDNTVIIFIAGDNGASAEGQMNGMYSEMTYFSGVPETVPDMLKHYDDWGGPSTYPHFQPDGLWPWMLHSLTPNRLLPILAEPETE